MVEREKPKAIIYDEEFAGLLGGGGQATQARRRPGTTRRACDDPTIDELIAQGDPSDVVPPSREGRAVILTSGTTGSPKGAARANPQSLDPAVALLARIPLKARQTAYIAAPLFHSWGFAHFTLGLILGSTYVLRRKFDPEQCLADIARYRADSLVVVPVMMQRIMELPEEVRAKYDTSSLKVVAASGSALPGDLANDWMDAFGDTLYNLYGSTEVAWASIATPGGHARRPRHGRASRRAERWSSSTTRTAWRSAAGSTGRIFVGNEMLFEGYTGGGTKDVIGGADGHRGRRPLRRGRPPVRRGPRRRDDRVRRRERLPEGDRGPARPSRRGRRGGRARRRGRDFGQRLRAFVVLERGKEVSEDDLKDYVKKNLARYKVPREIVFMDELPRNATGKVLKRELKEHEIEGREAAST